MRSGRLFLFRYLVTGFVLRASSVYTDLQLQQEGVGSSAADGEGFVAAPGFGGRLTFGAGIISF
jgi:hypothetical protein